MKTIAELNIDQKDLFVELILTYYLLLISAQRFKSGKKLTFNVIIKKYTCLTGLLHDYPFNI